MQQAVFGEGMFLQKVQVHALNQIFHDRNFFTFTEEIPTQISDFSLPACQLVYEVLSNYYRYYTDPKNKLEVDTFQSIVSNSIRTGEDVETELSPEEYESLISIMQQVIAPTRLNSEVVKKQFFEYIKETRLKRLMAQYEAEINRGGSSEHVLEELSAVKDLQFPEVTTDTRFSSGISDADQALILSHEELMRIPTGIPMIDKAILGGLSAEIGELGLGVALTGVGKTNLLLNFTIGAALANYRVLFITLELTSKELQRRLMSMLANINARKASSPVTEWTPQEMHQFQLIQRSKIKDHITMCEMIDRQYTTHDIHKAIEAWRKEVKNKYGTNDDCLVVMVDWLDLVGSSTKGKKEPDPWVNYENVCKELKLITGALKPIALWTVTQANRGASGASKLGLHHVSSSFSKNHLCSVVLGLAAEAEDNVSMENIDLDSTDADELFNCDRELTLQVMKNRTGPKYTKKVYQGPTLRMWGSKGLWQATEQMLNKGMLKEVFGNLVNEC